MNPDVLLRTLVGLAVNTLVIPRVRELLGTDTVPVQLITAATRRVSNAVLGMGDKLSVDDLKLAALVIADEVIREVEGRS